MRSLICSFLLLPVLCNAIEVLDFPHRILQGDLGVIRVRGIPPFKGYFAKEAIPFVKRGRLYEGVIGVDLCAPARRYRVSVGDRESNMSLLVEVKKRRLPLVSLKLPREKVEYSPRDLQRIGQEKALVRMILERGWDSPALWTRGFIFPLEGRITAEFGLRRLINGRYSSLHTGLDISAPKGSPVVATNSGKVVFVRSLLLEGNTVIIHHGLGLFSLYCHLERILVKEGEFVRRGERIGTVGLTGRATGPHLHWAIRFRKRRVSPESLLRSLGDEGWRKGVSSSR
ncbi:MAG: M23 family peptidase [Deltaproteobacteria bacterium]|nr:MAG: M23 family peptidase [Deltaproteobacteria bacterium]